jgi:drug/metabolite transporter superfamily protein YnfA
MLGLAASLAVLVVTAMRLRREASPAHGAALCLTGVTLVAPPGWHHYFAFLPFAQAVALGSPRSSPAPRVTAAVSWVMSAAPLALLGAFDRVYFIYSAWGGTTVAALLVWAALVATSVSPSSESTESPAGRAGTARARTGGARRR